MAVILNFDHRDDELAPDLAGVQAADGLGYLGERAGLFDDGSDLAGFGELTQRLEVLPAVRADERGEPLTGQRGERQGAELPSDSGPLASPALGSLAAGDDERAAGCQSPPQA
jgi:hypothetical protein